MANCTLCKGEGRYMVRREDGTWIETECAQCMGSGLDY